MLHPTEAIAIAPAISSVHLIFSTPASSSAPAGLSAQRPPYLQESPDPSAGTLEPTGHGSLGLPLAIPESLITRLPRKGGYPQTRGGGVVTPPSDLPETSASPTWVSAAVTRMFLTLRTVTIRPRRTLPDSAGLPPGPYSSSTCPSTKTLPDPTPHPERLSVLLLRTLG